ncbi:MAG: DNA recombination protein RecN, partial [Arcobacteraceae bacterium]|nr:DNA recombination protein RecN [Arcobacteraceae bacterium]
GLKLQTISSGEFNRLRLALLTAMSEVDIVNNGILFLDEIDANLSGKESSAIAKVLTELSKSYQIFAISHQAQLTASATGHFLVDKHNGKSHVRKLNEDERMNEIARMISGENITQEAKDFAQNLLK